MLFIARQECHFHEIQYEKGSSGEKDDGDVKTFKILNYGQLWRHNYQGKPLKYPKMHIIGGKSRQRHDAIYMKIATDNI